MLKALNNNDWPSTLTKIRNSIVKQECVLLAGCGLAAQAYVEDASGNPTLRHHPPSSWEQLLREMLAAGVKRKSISASIYRKINEQQGKDFRDTAVLQLEQSIPKQLQVQLLREKLLCYQAQVGEAHRILVSIPFPLYLSTNYDTFIEDAFLLVHHRRLMKLYEIHEPHDQTPFILKLHGDIEYPHSINITDRSFTLQRESSIWDSLQSLLITSSILAIGFEPEDVELIEFLKRIGFINSNTGEESNKCWVLQPVTAQQAASPVTRVQIESESIVLDIIRYNSSDTSSALLQFLKELAAPWLKQNELQKKTEAADTPSIPTRPKTIEIFLFFEEVEEDKATISKLLAHLYNLQPKESVTIWHPGLTQPGTNSQEEMSRHLESANIILPLVTVDFLNSSACGKLLQRSLERRVQGALVVPTILRPTSLRGSQLEVLEPLPSKGKPITDWETIDNACINICEELHKQINELQRLHPSDMTVLQSQPPPSA